MQVAWHGMQEEGGGADGRAEGRATKLQKKQKSRLPRDREMVMAEQTANSK